MTVEVDAKKVAAHAPKAEFKKKWNLVPANHPLLSTKLENFDLKNPPVDPVELATDMLAHMRYFGGIGLSANQLGLPYRVFVTEGDPGFACFNPRITAHAGEEVLMDEGCLSYPGLYIKKKRPQMIRVRFFSPTGEPIVKRFSGITARIFMHEMEHMDGENYLDGVNNIVLQRAKKKQQNLLRRVRRQSEGRSKHGTGKRRR
jgi:peptide deformylase|tara:strand:+ start:126 stop:731 length:606 start_codon:yes stop_codon:yes gene_type:complete